MDHLGSRPFRAGAVLVRSHLDRVCFGCDHFDPGAMLTSTRDIIKRALLIQRVEHGEWAWTRVKSGLKHRGWA